MVPSSKPPLCIDEIDLSRIAYLTLDSRQVRAGSFFLALPGQQVDGTDFVHEAAKKGAIALLVHADTDPKLLPAEFPNGPHIYRSTQPAIDAALIAARYYGPQPNSCGAVTGTNGKTSVVWFIRQLLEAAGHPTVTVGTLGLIPPSLGKLPALTTPDPVSLHQTLKHAKGMGYEHLVIEASSHGLDQHRLDGLRFDAVAFTNLSQDHLDYHPSMAAYKETKLRLRDLKTKRGQVITNADDRTFGSIPGWTYGVAGREARILAVKPTSSGLHLRTDESNLELPLIGTFQAHNVLCAMLMTRAMGSHTNEHLAAIKAVPGRMETVAMHRNGGLVLVDYAHTPDALATALKSARAHTKGRLICVFGAGGNRDQGKRPMMGKVVQKLADISFVTDDNPRFEDPALIRAAILVACPDAQEIGDRQTAIEAAIETAGPGDLVLIAGKGHERGQSIGTTTRPFDDRDVAREIASHSDIWQITA